MGGHICDDIPYLHRIFHGIASAPSLFLPFLGTLAEDSAHDKHGHAHTVCGKPRGLPSPHNAQRGEAKVLGNVRGKPRRCHTFLDTRGVLSYLLPNVCQPMDPFLAEALASPYGDRCQPGPQAPTRRLRLRIDAKTLQELATTKS